MSAPRVALVGASGYVGRELDQLLAGHPGIELAARMTARPGVVPEVDPEGIQSPIDPLEPGRLEGLDGVFLCTPHGAAAELARLALDAGCKVVDASADFRLRDPAVYEGTYGAPHPAPQLLEEAVYGLTEHAREEVAGSRLIANPGCYPTSILLPLLPLLEAGVIDSSATIVCDSKSGVSGAGKKPTATTLYGNVSENFQAYGVGVHRHTPEIQQGAGTNRLVFTPHLLPLFRGILSTIYVRPAAGLDAEGMRSILGARYEHEPFVHVRSQGMPQLADVQRTNRCDIGLAPTGDLVAIVSCIDNLVKGAAGQALQNMNVLLGLEETAGLAGSAPGGSA